MDAEKNGEMVTYLKESVTEVFQSFNIMDFQKYELLNGQVSFKGHYLVSMVGFVGEFTGMISLYCSKKIALQITSGMLGVKIEEIDQDVRDAVGEIGNIVVGLFKAKFGTEYNPFQQSVPSVLDGHNITGNNFNLHNNRLLKFEGEMGSVFVQLLLKS